MTKLPETVDVSLNLEESGWLCHLLMRQPDFQHAVLSGKTSDPIIRRQVVLYNKLAKANDKMMGKS